MLYSCMVNIFLRRSVQNVELYCYYELCHKILIVFLSSLVSTTYFRTFPCCSLDTWCMAMVALRDFLVAGPWGWTPKLPLAPVRILARVT